VEIRHLMVGLRAKRDTFELPLARFLGQLNQLTGNSVVNLPLENFRTGYQRPGNRLFASYRLDVTVVSCIN